MENAFSGKKVIFIDSAHDQTRHGVGYFMQIAHSTAQDVDYAYVVDESGTIHGLFINELTFVME